MSDDDVPVLVFLSGPKEGAVMPLQEGTFRLGRHEDNDIFIDNQDISRFHAKILYDNGTLWVQDIGSRNGVFVNGERVHNHRALKLHDVIRIVDTEIKVQWGSQKPIPTTSHEPSGGLVAWLKNLRKGNQG